jgi:hypothetical protein
MAMEVTLWVKLEAIEAAGERPEPCRLVVASEQPKVEQ